MIRHGEAPYLECSSKGDKRFSAFYARVRAFGNRSIEEIYQSCKVLPDGRTGLTWREAKGRRPTNDGWCRVLYGMLWDRYIIENHKLLRPLIDASGLSDQFGQEGHVCQATELWRIREWAIKHELKFYV